MNRIRYRMMIQCVAVLVVMGAGISRAVADPAAYVAIDLGTLGGPTADAFAVNNNGEVAGVSTLGDANLNGFVWDTSLTAFPPPADDLQSHAVAINSQGDVALLAFDLGELGSRGYLIQDGATAPLGDLAPRALNDAGMVAGTVASVDVSFGWVEHAATWDNGVVTDLPSLGGHFSYAHGINSAGDVVGMSFTNGDANWRAVLWRSGAAHDLGTLGGSKSYAHAIDDAGNVVGMAEDASGAPHAFKYTTNASGGVVTRTNLGTLLGGSSCAYAINASGAIVGTSDAAAVLWDGGGPLDLNEAVSPVSQWRLEIARSINDDGWIVGSGYHFGQPRAFLLVPGLPGDADLDMDVDLADHSLFHECMEGPYQPHPDGCDRHDIDSDGDVDMADFLGLTLGFTGQ